MERFLMVRQQISEIIKVGCDKSRASGFLPQDIDINLIIEIPREEEHGDYSTNIAFLLAPKLRKSPTEIAKVLIQNMDVQYVCDRVEVAAKGFINFHVKDDVWQHALYEVSEKGLDIFFPDVGEGKKILIEFVSSNPTGPLHIGHGRGA